MGTCSAATKCVCAPNCLLAWCLIVVRLQQRAEETVDLLGQKVQAYEEENELLRTKSNDQVQNSEKEIERLRVQLEVGAHLKCHFCCGSAQFSSCQHWINSVVVVVVAV